MKTRQELTADLKEARRELSTCSGPVKRYWQAKLREAQRGLDTQKRDEEGSMPFSRRATAGKSRHFEEL